MSEPTKARYQQANAELLEDLSSLRATIEALTAENERLKGRGTLCQCPLCPDSTHGGDLE